MQPITDQTTIKKPFPSDRVNLKGVIAVSIAHFIHDVYSSFLAPLLPLLIEKLSMTLTQAGLLSTVMQLPALINPWIGSLADRISVRWFLILAPALTAVPMSLIGIAPTYGVLLTLMLFAGISVSVFHVPAPVVVARMSANRKGLGMSFFMVGGEAARAAGPMVAVGIVALMGLDGFYPVMVVSFVCSALLFFATRDLPVTRTARTPVPLKQTWRDMRPILMPITGILVARGFMHGCMASFLPTFIAMNTGNLWLAGAGLTIFEIAGVAGVMVAGSLSDRIGRRRMLTLSLLGAPVSLLAFVWVDGWLAYAMLVLTGFTLLSTTPVMLALVQENAVESPSAANGLFMMISFLARSAVVVIVGMSGDLIGLKSTYIIFALVGFIGLPFAFKLPADSK
ncbi:MFS transporter [uncultured Desulfosarcina sp.]|uniref:MFS transporter n=1 Tax=uncultured Desulfosarcina sp. TaxID=218289 RepID=UPI0029C7C471|nr:MFS transporter [uncultured Desulfosarcina sp.]